MSVAETLGGLWADPFGRLVARWNWKSALMSSLIRGLIFFFTNLTAGLHAASGAFVAECCYRVLTSGFYGTITQSLSDAEPAWAGTLAALLLLPLGSHTLELALHLLRHTPKLGASLSGSASLRYRRRFIYSPCAAGRWPCARALVRWPTTCAGCPASFWRSSPPDRLPSLALLVSIDDTATAGPKQYPDKLGVRRDHAHRSCAGQSSRILCSFTN
jgi:hypothetical protein